jgi:hypothetical protein
MTTTEPEPTAATGGEWVSMRQAARLLGLRAGHGVLMRALRGQIRYRIERGRYPVFSRADLVDVAAEERR